MNSQISGEEGTLPDRHTLVGRLGETDSCGQGHASTLGLLNQDSCDSSESNCSS